MLWVYSPGIRLLYITLDLRGFHKYMVVQSVSSAIAGYSGQITYKRIHEEAFLAFSDLYENHRRNFFLDYAWF